MGVVEITNLPFADNRWNAIGRGQRAIQVAGQFPFTDRRFCSTQTTSTL